MSPWLRSTARLAWVGVLTGAGAGAVLALSLSVPRAWEPLDVVGPLVLGVTVGVLAALPTTALCALTGLLVLARRPSQRRLATFWLCSWPTVTAGLGLALLAVAGRYPWWYVIAVGVSLVAAVLASVLGSRRWVLSPGRVQRSCNSTSGQRVEETRTP